MNIICKCCNVITYYPNMEYFQHIKTLGFPLCTICNNCADCGNYICECLRCSDCWLVLPICRCDNDPDHYGKFTNGRIPDQQIESLITEIQKCNFQENNQINEIINKINNTQI